MVCIGLFGSGRDAPVAYRSVLEAESNTIPPPARSAGKSGNAVHCVPDGLVPVNCKHFFMAGPGCFPLYPPQLYNTLPFTAYAQWEIPSGKGRSSIFRHVEVDFVVSYAYVSFVTCPKEFVKPEYKTKSPFSRIAPCPSPMEIGYVG